MAATPATARAAAERRAAARPAAVPQPDHSYEPTVVRIAERFERTAREDDPIKNAVLALRDLAALVEELGETVLGLAPPSIAALNRLGTAMSAAVYPLAKAAGATVSSDHVALGLGCRRPVRGPNGQVGFRLSPVFEVAPRPVLAWVLISKVLILLD